jgi:hypothetical protein
VDLLTFGLGVFRLLFCVSLGFAFEFFTCYTGVEPEYPPLHEDEEEKKVKDKDMREDKHEVQEEETASAVRSRRRREGQRQQGTTPTAVRFARIKSDLGSRR